MYRFDHGRYALRAARVEHTCHAQTYLVQNGPMPYKEGVGSDSAEVLYTTSQ